MKIGACGNITWMGPPVVEVARAAEQLGFESLFMGEHIVIPVSAERVRRHGAELPPNYKHMPSPFISIAAAAAVTTRLVFGTNISLLAQHDPLVLAKDLATLDRISNGRFVFGIGTGWIEDESTVMGVDFKRKWARTMDHVGALKALWTEEQASYQGEFVSFPPVYSYPKPVQKPHIPILIGAGNPNTPKLDKTLRRVAEAGDGWLPAMFAPAAMKAHLATIRRHCDELGRDFAKLDITLIVPAATLGVGDAFASMGAMDRTPQDPQRLIAEYEEAGVTRIIVGLVDYDEQSGLRHLERAAKGLGLA
jgi:probable F420-dependent oxidoreductase